MMNFAIWQSILEQQWGIKAKLSSLDGEFDLNILVKANSTKNYVLKVMRSGCLQDFVDMQIKALNHLKVSEPELPFPEVVATLSGQKFVECKDEFGKIRLLWLIKKLPGHKYVDHGYKSLNLISQLGGMIAKCDAALKSFEHKFLHRDLKWNLSEASWVEDHVDLIEDSSRK